MKLIIGLCEVTFAWVFFTIMDCVFSYLLGRGFTPTVDQKIIIGYSIAITYYTTFKSMDDKLEKLYDKWS